MKPTKNYGLPESLIDAVKNAVSEAKKELTPKQKQLDVDKDGDIEADDLADLRKGKHKKDEIDMKPKMVEEVESVEEGIEDREAQARLVHAIMKGKAPKQKPKTTSNVKNVSGKQYGGSSQAPDSDDEEQPKKSMKGVAKGTFKRRFNTKTYAEGSLEEVSIDLAKRARDKAERHVDLDQDDLRDRPVGHSEKQRSKFQRYIDKKEPRAKGDRDWDPPRNEEVELDEATPNKQQVKQGIGIARDKRYAGGNMTGAVKAMDKLNKGIAQHPAVKKELQKQNEEVEHVDESELPKAVIKKGHEIAKSIIKHRKAKGINPYAVGMAAAKKKAGLD